jgi:siroheme synthase
MASYQQVAMQKICSQQLQWLPANKLAPPSVFEMILQHLEKISKNIQQHPEKI